METITLIISFAIALISWGLINVVRNFINWKRIIKKSEEDETVTKEEEKLIKEARNKFFKSLLSLVSMMFKAKIKKNAKPSDLINEINKKL